MSEITVNADSVAEQMKAAVQLLIFAENSTKPQVAKAALSIVDSWERTMFADVYSEPATVLQLHKGGAVKPL